MTRKLTPFLVALLLLQVACLNDFSVKGPGVAGGFPEGGTNGSGGAVGSGTGGGTGGSYVPGSGDQIPPSPSSGGSGSTTGSNVASGVPDLGAGASLHGKLPFPADNAWNQDISSAPVDPDSATLIAGCGSDFNHLHADFGTFYNGVPNGIPYVVVSGTQPPVAINFTAYGDESDPGPYPVPPDAPIEGGPDGTGDRHVLVVDRDNWKLYEMDNAFPQNGGQSWDADGGALFDLSSDALRPLGWTSADAAGLPIFPGLVRYDEAVELRAIRHALRFTCLHTRKGFVAPARHYASSNTSTSLPPMGMRVRLRASFDVSSYPPEVQVILNGLKHYGMFLADNGSSWFVSGAPDPRWSDDNLATLRQVMTSDLEVVQMGPVTTSVP